MGLNLQAANVVVNLDLSDSELELQAEARAWLTANVPAEPLPSIAVPIFYVLSAAAVVLALKRLDLSVTYAIWSGVGTALAAWGGGGSARGCSARGCSARGWS